METTTEKKIRSLNHIPVGNTVIVHQLLTKGAMRRRLQDIGIIEGSRICCLQKSPAGDPISYLVRGAVIALRREESANILVEPI